jgi:hypothetical protein
MLSTQTNKLPTRTFICQRLLHEERHTRAIMGPNIISTSEVPCTRSAGTGEGLRYVYKKGWVATEALKPIRGLAEIEANKCSIIVANSRHEQIKLL